MGHNGSARPQINGPPGDVTHIMTDSNTAKHTNCWTSRPKVWEIYAPWAMALVFVIVSFALMNAKHSAFNTRTYDFARFVQAVWNSLHGRFLFETITYGSILGNHFSPIMALASPFVVLFQSERILFLIQAVNAAATGLILHRFFRERQPQHPSLALWFLLAYYLNPALHGVTLLEVRRIAFGMPFLALGLYGLGTHRRGAMLFGLVAAMLAKESVSLYVAMVGLYLLLVEKDWRWGLGMTMLGAAWLVGIGLYVIPQFSAAEGHEFVYPQLYYFSHLGGTYGEIAGAILRTPLDLARQMLGPLQLQGIGRILLPVGLVLPFLEPRWIALCLPYLGLMLISSDVDMLSLDKWYPATILPVIFGAIAIGWRRIPNRWQPAAMVWLLACTASGYAWFSQAPLGGRYSAADYQITDHDRIAMTLLEAVPDNAKVAAQVHYVPHLALRTDIYHYPWIRIGEDAIDYFVLDRKAPAYPFDEQGISEAITNKVADPSVTVVAEADGIYVLRSTGRPLRSHAIGRTAEDAIHLERIEIAIADQDGSYHSTMADPIVVLPGDNLRVTLYWEALAAPEAERTVSVKLTDAGGDIVAQHDSIPGTGSKPTSWWQAGWKIRDVYYLTIPADAPPSAGFLDIVLYDTYTLEIVPFAGTPGKPADDVLHLVPATIG